MAAKSTIADGSGEQTAAADVLDTKVAETDEWAFHASIRVRLRNPDGDDVVALKKYRARPKYDDLTSAPDKVHESTTYWWTDAYPANGDGPFWDASHEWESVADLSDGNALLDECLENATFDPRAELDTLVHNAPDRIATQLQGE